jgi:ATP-dependent Lon protease
MEEYQPCPNCGEPELPTNEFDENGNEYYRCQNNCNHDQYIRNYAEIYNEIGSFEPYFGEPLQVSENAALVAKAIEIKDGEKGHSYQSLFGDYLIGAEDIEITDPFLSLNHQLKNLDEFLRFLIKIDNIKKIRLKTRPSNDSPGESFDEILKKMRVALIDIRDVDFSYEFNEKIHDRKIKTDTGWLIHLGRGLNIYKPRVINEEYDLESWDYHFRECLETTISIVPVDNAFDEGK